MLGIFGTSREKALFMTMMVLLNILTWTASGEEWLLWLAGLAASVAAFWSYDWYKARV